MERLKDNLLSGLLIFLEQFMGKLNNKIIKEIRK